MVRSRPRTGTAWIEKWFEAKTTLERGVVRRAKADINKYASFDLVRQEAKRRKWHIVEVGDQWVVICNSGDIQIVQ